MKKNGQKVVLEYQWSICFMGKKKLCQNFRCNNVYDFDKKKTSKYLQIQNIYKFKTI